MLAPPTAVTGSPCGTIERGASQAAPRRCIPAGEGDQVCLPRELGGHSAITAIQAMVALVIGGAVTLLIGLGCAARAVIISRDAIDYEVQRVLSLRGNRTSR